MRVITAIFLLTFSFASLACTIFVLVGEEKVLFGNNEDNSNPSSRVWFVPAGEEYFGVVYIGNDDGWGQGGMNTEGLAYDWVAGFDEENFIPVAGREVIGNPAERMIESSSTVENAIAYFKSHPEISFTYAKIMVADKTGASAIIGSRNGKLHVERSLHSRGFGYCGSKLRNILSENPASTFENSFSTLSACSQLGKNATKYSNVFDLSSLDIRIRSSAIGETEVKFNLLTELKKGGHYYDIPFIDEQLDSELKPLTVSMKRLYGLDFEEIEDHKPEITSLMKKILADFSHGEPVKADFTTEFWEKLTKADIDQYQSMINSFGNLLGVSLLERSFQGDLGISLYRLDFENVILIQRLVTDGSRKVVDLNTENYMTKW